MEPAPDKAASAPSKLRTTKVPLWVALVLAGMLLAALAASAIYQRNSERRYEIAAQELTQKLDKEKAAVQSLAQEALTRHGEEAHRLFGTALAWAVRSALMRGNYDEIDQYFTELVRNQRIRLILLADNNGKVVLATDRDLKGANFGQHFPAALLDEPAVAIHAGEGQLRRLVMPIQGLSARMGTALLVYEAPSLPGR